MLLSASDPTTVLRRTDRPFFMPERPWEKTGQVGNVVFLEGLAVVGSDALLYYGTADSKIAVARWSGDAPRVLIDGDGSDGGGDGGADKGAGAGAAIFAAEDEQNARSWQHNEETVLPENRRKNDAAAAAAPEVGARVPLQEEEEEEIEEGQGKEEEAEKEEEEKNDGRFLLVATLIVVQLCVPLALILRRVRRAPHHHHHSPHGFSRARHAPRGRGGALRAASAAAAKTTSARLTTAALPCLYTPEQVGDQNDEHHEL